MASQDFLNYTIAFCVLWVTVFLCWIMYYVISVFKKMDDSLKLAHIIMTSINTFIENAKGKFKNSFANLELVGMLIKKVIEQIEVRKENKKSKTKSQKK